MCLGIIHRTPSLRSRRRNHIEAMYSQIFLFAGLVAVTSAFPGRHHAEHENLDNHANPKYDSEYGVSDYNTGDQKSQWEARDGDVVKGAYSLHEADGTIRVVEYTADKQNGFNAVVKRQGEAVHPHHYAPNTHQQGGNYDAHGAGLDGSATRFDNGKSIAIGHGDAVYGQSGPHHNGNEAEYGGHHGAATSHANGNIIHSGAHGAEHYGEATSNANGKIIAIGHGDAVYGQSGPHHNGNEAEYAGHHGAATSHANGNIIHSGAHGAEHYGEATSNANGKIIAIGHGVAAFGQGGYHQNGNAAEHGGHYDAATSHANGNTIAQTRAGYHY